jgi:hypothetical protein
MGRAHLWLFLLCADWVAGNVVSSECDPIAQRARINLTSVVEIYQSVCMGLSAILLGLMIICRNQRRTIVLHVVEDRIGIRRPTFVRVHSIDAIPKVRARNRVFH